VRATLLCLLLAACAMPQPGHYEAKPWATKPAEQAEQECFLAMQRNDDVSLATCMRSKGWYPT
jgi:hypothetical protein